MRYRLNLRLILRAAPVGRCGSNLPPQPEDGVRCREVGVGVASPDRQPIGTSSSCWELQRSATMSVRSSGAIVVFVWLLGAASPSLADTVSRVSSPVLAIEPIRGLAGT